MLKKIVALSYLTIFTLFTQAQTPCIDGMAGGFPCQNINLLSFVEGSDIGGGEMNDIWGWVDPTDGTEYVIIGRTNGTAFIDISDPLNPVYVANVPTATYSSMWRDIKVYNNHAFIVAEASDHGMQVVDLMQLGEIIAPPVTLEPDYLYAGFSNAHNIVINKSTARAYGVGTSTFDGGLHILDISNPTNPQLIGDFPNDGYTHDAQVVSYEGPDTNFGGKEIAFCCNENTVTIVDVTDASDCILISSASYDGVNYTHQGWLTEDHKYFICNDELDEQNLGINTTTFIWDVTDLSEPELIGTFVSDAEAIDHNLYIHEGLVYQSNYRAGLRVLGTENVAEGELEEMGYFDVYPQSNSAQFSGTWSNYPYFPSGVIAVSHIEGGLFLLKLVDEFWDLGCTDSEACNYDSEATVDDGSCVGYNECGGCEGDELFCYGCTDDTMCNFDLEATIDDGSCLEINDCGGCEGEELFCYGCTDSESCNYDEEATIDDGSCFVIVAPEPQTITQTTEPVTFINEPSSYWFETETSTEEIHIGESFTMVFSPDPQSIWVSNSNGEFGVVGGKEGPDYNNGQYHENNAYWMIFDVYEEVLFESVEVYSEQGGIQEIEILNPDGSLASSISQFLTAGLNVFELGVVLSPGEGYEIRSGTNDPYLWRDDAGAQVNFPYDIGSLASITSTTITSENQYNYYYFYYNWKMSSNNPCLSERTEFNVFVDDQHSIDLIETPERTIVKITDLLGREVRDLMNQIVIIYYSDNSYEKRILSLE